MLLPDYSNPKVRERQLTSHYVERSDNSRHLFVKTWIRPCIATIETAEDHLIKVVWFPIWVWIQNLEYPLEADPKWSGMKFYCL